MPPVTTVSLALIVYIACPSPGSAVLFTDVIFVPALTSVEAAATMDVFAFLSCATLTASVSFMPAATPVIWRVIPLDVSPTETAAYVDFHTEDVSVEFVPVPGS